MASIDPATPAGYTSVAPWVVTDDTGALLDFVAVAFDGEELARVQTADGLIGHGEIRVGDTVVLAFDRRPEWPSMPSLLRVWVPDAEVAFARAVEQGATVVTELGDNAFGQRGGRVKDPLGNIWWITEQVETVPEDVIWQRLEQPEYSENMRYAQESLDAELSGSASGRSSAPTRAGSATP